jgi:hypothetical protein
MEDVSSAEVNSNYDDSMYVMLYRDEIYKKPIIEYSENLDVAFSPQLEKFAFVNMRGIFLEGLSTDMTALASRRQLVNKQYEDPFSLMFSEDGRQISVIDNKKSQETIDVFDTTTGERLWSKNVQKIPYIANVRTNRDAPVNSKLMPSIHKTIVKLFVRKGVLKIRYKKSDEIASRIEQVIGLSQDPLLARDRFNKFQKYVGKDIIVQSIGLGHVGLSGHMETGECCSVVNLYTGKTVAHTSPYQMLQKKEITHNNSHLAIIDDGGLNVWKLSSHNLIAANALPATAEPDSLILCKSFDDNVLLVQDISSEQTYKFTLS